MFLGTIFLSGKNSLYPPATNVGNITNVSMFDGIYDRLFVSKDETFAITNIDDDWNNDTVMSAPYETNLNAGNSSFNLKNTDTIIIKRREVGTIDYITIFQKDIVTVDDFDIDFNYYFARGECDYEWMVVSMINGIENSYVVVECRSEFDGMYICNKNEIYGTIYDLDGCDTNTLMTNSVIELLNNEYVQVASNSIAISESGSVTGTFIKVNENDCKFNAETSLKFRNTFKDIIKNSKRQPLVLKVDDGRIWIIQATALEDKKKDHRDIRQLTFSWSEVGDINDMKTLYKKNLSDVSSEWWY